MIKDAVLKMAFEKPDHGQVRVSNELKKHGYLISLEGIHRAWLRHDLETFKKRHKALKAKVAQDGGVLFEEQVVTFEKAKFEKAVHR